MANVNEIKINVRSLLISSAKRVTISCLERDYKKFIGTQLPYAQLGYKSAELFLRAIPDVVTVIGNGPHALVKGIPSEKTKHIARNQKWNPKKTPMNRHNPYNSGVPMYDNKTLVYNINTNTYTILGEVNEVKNIQNDKENQNETTTSEGTLKLNESANNQNSMQDKIIEENFQKNIGIKSVGNNKNPSTPYPMVIPQYTLYENLEKGSIISLVISEIHNPLLFFFHINEEKHKLIEMENQMKNLYSFLESYEMEIPHHHLKVGQIYAARNDEDWHRVKILSLPQYLTTFQKAEVLFIDYGSICKVPIKNLKLLAQSFFEVPTQAVRGRLAQFELTQKIISTEATKYFESLVCDRCISAYVKEVNKDIPSLSLILVDKSVQLKYNINKTMAVKRFGA